MQTEPVTTSPRLESRVCACGLTFRVLETSSQLFHSTTCEAERGSPARKAELQRLMQCGLLAQPRKKRLPLHPPRPSAIDQVDDEPDELEPEESAYSVSEESPGEPYPGNDDDQALAAIGSEPEPEPETRKEVQPMQMITAAEVAAQVPCSPTKVGQLFKAGKIAGERINARKYLFEPTVVESVRKLLTRNGKDGPVAPSVPAEVSHEEVEAIEPEPRKKSARKVQEKCKKSARKVQEKRKSTAAEDESVELMFQAALKKAAVKAKVAWKGFLFEVVAEAKKSGYGELELKLLRHYVETERDFVGLIVSARGLYL